MSTKREMPAAGGRYLRQKDGTLAPRPIDDGPAKIPAPPQAPAKAGETTKPPPVPATAKKES